ncbi:MAG: hypothetical protein LBH81_03790 [Rickettsiales bacterium]|jgi:hypothetical protein|nr:hypothetical protein [Rickettsiales bacterium]
MKNIVKGLAIATAVLTGANGTAGAQSTKNLENPLYIPTAGEVWSKTAAGLVYKETDHTDALKAKDQAGQTEFPIWNLYQDLGVGITDRLNARGGVRYTYNDETGRKGLSGGNAGLSYRVFEGAATNGIVFDVYGLAGLGGLSEMTGEFIINGNKKYFNYDNYSHGRYSAIFGASIGKQFDKLSVGVYGDVVRVFGNDNNEIRLGTSKSIMEANLAPLGGSTAITACLANPGAGSCPALLTGFNANVAAQTAYAITQMPDSIAVNLKSTTEYNAGLKALYEIDQKWSVGGTFAYKFHADNGVESIATKIANPYAANFAKVLAAGMENMDDGFAEYIVGVLGAYQINAAVQTAVYAEYTFDTAHANSQSGSDVKAELGVRLNARF